MAGRGRARPGAELGSPQGVPSLGLQRKRIEEVESLGCFPSLRFLSLAGNRIRRVENLRPLRHLRFLDLSQNQIQTLDPGELPRGLRLLDLTGNACTQQPGYRELVVGALPHLLQLDSRPLRGCTDPAPGEEEEEEGSSSSEDDDDELFSEPSAPFTADKDFFADLHQELAGRSRRRQGEALQEHQSRLQGLRGLLLPPPSPAGLSRHRDLPSPQPRGRWSSLGPRPQAGSAPSPGEARDTAVSPPRAGQAAPPPAASANRPQGPAPQRGPARGDKQQRSKEIGGSPGTQPRHGPSRD